MPRSKFASAAGQPPRWPWRAPGRAGRRHGLVIRAHEVEMDDRKTETCASRRGSSRAAARASASRRPPDTPSRQTERAPSAGRAGDPWPARACRVSPADAGGPERLLEVPHGLAVSRPRHGLLPACRQYVRALSHTSPRRAWWAAVRPARPPAPRRAPPGPRRCGHAAPAAAPAGGCRRPPHGSGRA